MTSRLELLLIAAASLWLPALAEASCTVSTTSLIYGAYDVLAPSALDSTGSVTYDCLEGTASVMITLDNGSASTFDRELTSGTRQLRHNLFLDAPRTRVWGDGTDGTEYHVDATPPATAVTLTIHGRVPAGQSVPAGNYADSVTATIHF